MRKVFGIIFASLAAYTFVSTVFTVVPNDSAYATGYNIGAHLAWIVLAFIAYSMLKPKGDSNVPKG